LGRENAGENIRWIPSTLRQFFLTSSDSLTTCKKIVKVSFSGCINKMKPLSIYTTASILFIDCLFSNPHEPLVISGNVEFHENTSNVLEVFASDSTIIEWKDFNIDPGETTRFIQPNETSIVMNRVLDFAPSKLMGRLESNGQVLILNPNGILIGKDAVINTGSFIASTLDLQNDFFFNQDFKFEGNSSASIVHEGSICAKGDVFLFGNQIKSRGRTQGDNVYLVAGNQMGFVGKGSERIYFRTSNDSLLTFDGNVFGNKAYLFADRIDISSTAQIDVSQDFVGGTILVGGDFQGANSRFSNARQINVEKGAVFNASSRINGDGGKVIFWGEETTFFHGSVLAQGGDFGGDGGFVEVSGKILDFQGKVLALAPKGKTGTLLLDPVDVIIGAGGVAPACGVNNPAANTIFDNGLLSGVLGGCSVTIQTLAGVGGAGNITVNAPVTWASGTLLTLNAANNITINAGGSLQESSGASTGGVVLIAPDGATITINGGNTIPTRTSVGSANGITSVGDPSIANPCARTHPNLTLIGAGALIANSDIGARLGFNGTLATGPIEVVCSNLFMSEQNSSVQIGHGLNNVVSPLTINAPITVSASGTITLQNISGANAPSTLYASIGHGASLYIAAGSNVIGNITITAGGNILLTNSVIDKLALIGHARLANVVGNVDSFQGNISVSSAGSITLNSFTASGASIGHYAGSNAANIAIGDIYVSAITDVNLIGMNFSVISHTSNFLVPAMGINSTINVIAGRDINLLMVAGGQARGLIGGRLGSPADLIGDVKVFAGRDINLQNRSLGMISVNPITIGYTTTVAGDGNSNTFVGAGGNLNFLDPITIGLTIRAPGNVSVGISGNIVSSTTSQTSFISTTNTIPVSSGGGAVTRIWAGGNIVGNVNTFFGSPTGAGQSSSIDIRAGGTIINPNNFNTSQGFFFMAAPTTFLPGQLWTTALNPPRLETACTEGSSTAVAFNNCFAGPVTPINSPQNAPITTSTLPAVAITTTTGAITLSSPLVFASSNTQISSDPAVMLTPCSNCTNFSGDLTLGPGSTQIATMSGNITIGTFRDIAINQAVTTSGNIDISACRDLNSNENVSTTAFGFVHLSGTNVNIAGGVDTVNGNICINSGQTTNIISNITSTGGGTISFVAETLLISSAITTSNSIMMISQNMSLFAPASIISIGSAVTLVVDANHPSPPLPTNPSLLGALNMGGGTSISSGMGFPLSIFTAQQNLNSIGGTLNGTSFMAGPLFTDTTSEIWCTYAPSLIDCSRCLFQMGCTANCPSFLFFSNGNPFTIYYKDCLQLLTQQAQQIIGQFQVNLHPYNEFPGWTARFLIVHREKSEFNTKVEPYFIRRRHLSFFNHPKTWTILIP